MAPPHDSAAPDVAPPLFSVSASTLPPVLAEAVAKVLREQEALELQAIGAGAVYRTTVALCLARALLAKTESDLGFIPTFREAPIDGKTLVGMSFEVEARASPDVPLSISS